MLQQGLLAGAGGVLPDSPAAAVGVAADVVVDLELKNARQDHVHQTEDELLPGAGSGIRFSFSDGDRAPFL